MPFMVIQDQRFCHQLKAQMQLHISD